jgi:hypothetical protein
MKRWLWLSLVLAAPLSSPLGCGGDGCLRNSDCASDYVCRAGRCELETPPASEDGGEGATELTPSGGSSAGNEANGGNAGSAGKAGSTAGAGKANAGGEHASAGQPAELDGGAGGAGGAGGQASAAAGEGGGASFGGAP